FFFTSISVPLCSDHSRCILASKETLTIMEFSESSNGQTQAHRARFAWTSPRHGREATSPSVCPTGPCLGSASSFHARPIAGERAPFLLPYRLRRIMARTEPERAEDEPCQQ